MPLASAAAAANFQRNGGPLFDGYSFAPADYQLVSVSGTWAFQNVALTVNGNLLQVSFTPVPEPAAVGLLAVAGLLAVWRLRRAVVG